MAEQQYRFSAKITIAGINPYVDVPADVVEALGAGQKAAVLVQLAGAGRAAAENTGIKEMKELVPDAQRLQAIGRLTADGWFRTSLVPSRFGPTRLYLDQWMRTAAGLGVGDQAQVTLKGDPDPRELAMPEALSAALAEDTEDLAAWDNLAPSRQREILSYLNFLKSPAALERNVRKVLAQLKAH